MADIGKLAVKMAVSPGTFERDIQSAIAQVQSFGAAIANIGSGQFSISGALGQLPGIAGQAAAAIAGLGASLMSASAAGITFIGQVSGLSRRFQLDVGAANDLAIASQRVGIETSTLDSAIGRMNLTLGHAAGGSGEAKRAFQALGLDFRELAGLGVDQSLALIGDRLNGLGTESQRTAAAQAIFGRGWAEIDPLLRGGSEALERAAVMSQRFGLSVSQLDVANLREMRQSSRDVGMAFEGISMTLARALIPILTTLNNITVEFLAYIKPVFDVLGNIITAVGSAVKWVANLSGGMATLIQAIAGAAAGGLAAFAAYTALSVGLTAARVAMQLLTVSAITLRGALISTGLGALVVALGVVINYLAGTDNAITQAGAAAQRAGERVDEFGNRITETAQQATQRLRALQQVYDAVINGRGGQPDLLQGLTLQSNPHQALAAAQQVRDSMNGRPDFMQSQGADPEGMARLSEELEKADEALRKNVATVAMSKDQTELWTLAQHGATAAQLAHTEALMAASEAATLENDIKKQTKALRDQVAAFGEAKGGIERQRLAQRGATEEMLAGFDEQAEALKDLNERKKFEDEVMSALNKHGPAAKASAGVQEGSAGAVSAVNAAILQAQTSKQTPEEKIIAAIKETNATRQRAAQDLRRVRELMERADDDDLEE